jgi:hypothetical protein
MSNIFSWFEDFPGRALQLLEQFEPIAAKDDLVGSLCLVTAHALVIAPYERLQTYSRRMNPQKDFLQFQSAHKQFDTAMTTPFFDAPFWTEETRPMAREWRNSRVVRNISFPSEWQTDAGAKPHEAQFWSNDVPNWETRFVWKSLRDSLAHWNVVTSDQTYNFGHDASLERLLFYRSDNDRGPWDVIGVPVEVFSKFLRCWATFLANGFVRDALAASGSA